MSIGSVPPSDLPWTSTESREEIVVSTELAPSALFSRALTAHQQGQLATAEGLYRQALHLQPALADAHNNLGALLFSQGRFDEALASYRQAVRRAPASADAYNNLGILLKNLGRHGEAERAYRQALRLRPDFADSYYNLGLLYAGLGYLAEAETAYRRAMACPAGHAEAPWNLGMLLLSQGRFSEGWPHYEARLDPHKKPPRVDLPPLPWPRWQGQSLAGKRLLIWPEQGFGDEIQFCRYLPLLKAQGAARITLVCKDPLAELFASVEGADAVIPLSAAGKLPRQDFWTLPLSLPLWLQTTPETIPTPIPYLAAPPARLEKWRQRLPTAGLRVGLSWKGSGAHHNDAHRSLAQLRDLAPLWQVPGVSFVSLQKGTGETEALAAPADQPIAALGHQIEDFADSAALVAQLDLVICVDTAVAHLAGALGKRCWVLLPARETDWRWLRGRQDSPWYPGTMRLFRQPQPGQWATLLATLAAELAALVVTSGEPAAATPETRDFLEQTPK